MVITGQKIEMSGQMTWIFLVVGAIFSAFAFLINLYNDVQIKSVIFFTLMYILFYVLLFTLPFYHSKFEARIKSGSGIRAFYLQDLTIKNIAIWVPLGLTAILGVAYITGNIHQQIAGIILSGIILMVAFRQTKSILIPIIIHGSYNSIVVYLQSSGLLQNSFLATAPIQVPIIGLSIAGKAQFASEILYQYLLVATAEELMKVLIIAFFVVNLSGGFNSKSIWVYGGMAVAVVLWGFLHIVQCKCS